MGFPSTQGGSSSANVKYLSSLDVHGVNSVLKCINGKRSKYYEKLLFNIMEEDR